MGWSIFCMAVTAVFCLFVPAAVAIYLIKKKKANWQAFLLGIVAFGVSQLLIRIPLLNLAQGTVWFTLFTRSEPVLYLLLLALTAGIFEEGGRFLCMRFGMRRESLTFWNGIAFGLGHGGLEAFALVGVNYAVTIFQTIGGTVDPSILVTPASLFLIGGLERALTIFVHIGLTFIVLYGVRQRKPVFLLLAVLAHMLVDSFTLILGAIGLGNNTLALEGYVALFAVLGLLLTLKMKKVLNNNYVSGGNL